MVGLYLQIVVYQDRGKNLGVVKIFHCSPNFVLLLFMKMFVIYCALIIYQVLR